MACKELKLQLADRLLDRVRQHYATTSGKDNEKLRDDSTWEAVANPASVPDIPQADLPVTVASSSPSALARMQSSAKSPGMAAGGGEMPTTSAEDGPGGTPSKSVIGTPAKTPLTGSLRKPPASEHPHELSSLHQNGTTDFPQLISSQLHCCSLVTCSVLSTGGALYRTKRLLQCMAEFKQTRWPSTSLLGGLQFCHCKIAGLAVSPSSGRVSCSSLTLACCRCAVWPSGGHGAHSELLGPGRADSVASKAGDCAAAACHSS